MDATLEKRFLEHSAAEPMSVLRKRVHQGENLYKPVPEEISIDKALEDIDYVQYVLENSYSGYTYYEKKLFDNAFHSIRDLIAREPNNNVNRLIDTISE